MNPKNEDGPSGQPSLSEEDFIQNRWSLSSMPFWLWLFLIAAIALVIGGTKGWYDGWIKQEKTHEPFLEVTNRQFSVFLWQFPSFMRRNASQKNGYLPGFLSTQENVDLENSENLVSAPPDLIFLYHTWHRLLAPEFIPRPILVAEFNEFLQQLPEWQPQNWKDAPEGYVKLIESQPDSKENLQNLPESVLPMMVKQAFQGWKNYFKEGDKINDLKPTFAQLITFLKQYPHYARPYWRNIDLIHHQFIAGPHYLYDMLNENFAPDAMVPHEQLPSFLKVALFNAEQAQQDQ